jgi:hypothetical protein
VKLVECCIVLCWCQLQDAEAASVYTRPVFTELTPGSPDERKVRSRNIMPGNAELSLFV